MSKKITFSGRANILELEKLRKEKEASYKVQFIKLEKIIRNHGQPRKDFNEEKIQELSESIKAQGVLQPILLREANNNTYEIIAGERRFRASRLAGLTEIPAIVKTSDDEQSAVWALIENIQRENLNILEEAIAFSELIKQYGYTQQELADIVGKSRPAVANILRLLKLSSIAQDHLRNSDNFEMGHARALLSLNNDEQIQVVNKIIHGKLNVRQTEQLVQRIKNPTINTPALLPPAERELLEIWRQRLLPYTSQVKVKMDAKDKIKLTIECTSTDEAEMLINEIERVKSPS